MASIKKRRGKYYSRVRWYNDLGQRKEQLVPLKTDKKHTAVIRNNEVEKVQDLIAEGQNWEFGWMAEGGKAKILRLSIEQAVKDYIAIKRIDGREKKTIEINQLALSLFMDRYGYKKPIEFVTWSDIKNFKEWSQKVHAPNTTNIYLAKIKTFLRFCYKKKYIKNEVEVDMVRAEKKPPMYLSETKLSKLFTTDCVDEHFRRSFLFYVMTGCRLREPFEGEVTGDWLIIKPEVAKTNKTREVQLNQITKSILIEMRNRYDRLINSSGNGTWSKSHRGITDTYSRQFKKAARYEGFGEHKLHNLRDTYAVRRWNECGDIFLVSKEIGHASVTETQRYANFRLQKLAVDFPSLDHIIQARIGSTVSNDSVAKLGMHLLAENGKGDTLLGDTKIKYPQAYRVRTSTSYPLQGGSRRFESFYAHRR